MKIKRKRAFNGKAACPCGNNLPYAECCQPFHLGELPTTPELLMRSRYTAYAKGMVDYIIDTTDPTGTAWDADMSEWIIRIRKFAQKTTFGGVKILASSVDGEQGVVRFHAKLTGKSSDLSFTEKSQFVRREGRWLYNEGVVQ
jgi:SEC-C motif-containing protein